MQPQPRLDLNKGEPLRQNSIFKLLFPRHPEWTFDVRPPLSDELYAMPYSLYRDLIVIVNAYRLNMRSLLLTATRRYALVASRFSDKLLLDDGFELPKRRTQCKTLKTP